MPDRDPLIDLLHLADGASAPPASSPDLPDRVRARRARQVARNKRLTIGSTAIAAVAVALLALVTFNRLVTNDTPQPAASSLPPAEVAALRAQSDQLAAEADALNRQLNLLQREQSLDGLRQEHQSYLLAEAAGGSLPPLDRAALIGISQGDFYRDIRQSLGEAKAAYESVITDFPDTRWAALAQSRIELLMMN